jgi:phosphatidylserine decarboxylase
MYIIVFIICIIVKKYFTFQEEHLLKKYVYRFFIELTNRPYLSKLLENFTKSSYSKFLIPSFVKTYQINIDEMKRSPKDYQTLHDLFTRQLKKEVRNVADGDDIVTSPVDAVIEEFGPIMSNQTFIAKGKAYSISEMLHKEEIKKKYINGTFVILYLSPSHYHRIHAPISGEVTNQWSLGTSSYPVNRLGIKYGKSPFTKNYRVITEVENNGVHLSIVKVGAMFVNGIELTHSGESITKGEEIGYFAFGSTVILLFEKDSFSLGEHIYKKMDIQIGQPLGTIKKGTIR